jgi:hypothetical protein
VLLRRELAIAFGARVTWVIAALGALFVGHGHVLAVALYASASRSVASGTLMQRELDPLAGVLRPTLGGVELAVTLLVPIVAARQLAVEKERGSFGPLALSCGSPTRVVLAKLVAAIAASMLLVAPALVLAASFVAMGGHLDAIETVTALGGHVLHAAFVAAVSVAAAAWSRTVAQATTIALVVACATWIADTGEGYAALAWLGPLQALSVSRLLAPLEAGVVALGSLAWLVSATLGASLLAVLGGRFDLRRRDRASRALGAAGVLVATGLALGLSLRVATAYDWTEYRRASYPPAVVDGLRALGLPVVIDVWLDREDSRRKQLERDALAKLALARIDLTVDYPLDHPRSSHAYDRGDTYGQIVIHVGDRTGDTRSTSRRELATRIFEIAGRGVPSFDQISYPGYPAAWDERRLRWVAVFAYVLFPCSLLGAHALTRRRRKV